MTDKAQKNSVARRTSRRTNDIAEDHGDWLLVDISTPKYPDSKMAVDADVWERREGGRVRAALENGMRYIHARTNIAREVRCFHLQVIEQVDGFETDHITHGTMSFIDNRRSNLRMVTGSQNNQNRGLYANNRSGAAGVCWDKTAKKWRARISLNGQARFLGHFSNIQDAIDERKAAERKYFGEYAFKGASK